LGNVAIIARNPSLIKKDILEREKPAPLRYLFITKHHKDKATQQFKYYQHVKKSKLASYIPYNIIEELKRTSSKMTMFDAFKKI